MIIGICGTHPEDGRRQMIVGITPHDLIKLATEGCINLNDGEPEHNPLPIHMLLMMDDSNEALEERLQKANAQAEQGDTDGNADV